MQLAFYKGPARRPLHRLAHWLVCKVTRSKYSHCELVIDGVCYSSSWRDGGVRGTLIDLSSGRWDVLDVRGDELAAKDWFIRHWHAPYDYAGLLGFVLPWRTQNEQRWFCSEACAAALGLHNPERISPQWLYDRAAWRAMDQCAEIYTKNR